MSNDTFTASYLRICNITVRTETIIQATKFVHVLKDFYVHVQM